MRLLIYGGSFNPPHIGHIHSVHCAIQAVRPDKTIVIPAGDPPHKELPEHSPTSEERLALTRLAFADMKNVIVSDMEIRREGKSYTFATLLSIRNEYPKSKLFFLIGTDMLMSFENWYRFQDILNLATLVILPRNHGDLDLVRARAKFITDTYGGNTIIPEDVPLPADSTSLRRDLPLRKGRELLKDAVYAEIVRCRFYGAKPELAWLRDKAYFYLKHKRIPHVQGCEQEAVRLAEFWGEDPDEAAEAGILHDITKKRSREEQLDLIEKYGIPMSSEDLETEPIWHAITGPYFARELFGIPDTVFNAIRWHTTGRPGMSRLEMIVFLADYMEPTRDFDGVDNVRELAYKSLLQAMLLSSRMSLEHIGSKGTHPHPMTKATLDWLVKQGEL